MIEHDIRSRGISCERVLSAIAKIKREDFIPQKSQPEKTAYADRAVEIECEQTISQPYIVALMTELLCLSGNENVLEIGTGSGYQTAVLCELSKFVYTVERHKNLSLGAQKVLNYDNVIFSVQDGSKGWEQHAPYDRIIVTAAAPDITKSLVAQLALNGKMVIPVGNLNSQVLRIIERSHTGEITMSSDIDCRFVPLIGEQGHNI